MNIFIASIENNTAVLTAEESLHCAKVLRMKEGEKIHLIDGKGNFYEGALTKIHEKKCEAEINSGPVPQKKRNYYLHLVIAPTKQIDRIEWMAEKAVEIGIDEISFVQCKNSERVVVKHERVRKIVESAVKQSLQAFIPRVNPIVSFADFVNGSLTADLKIIAHCSDLEKKDLKKMTFKNKSAIALIGPEGDFTNGEINLALKNSFEAVSLGENRLRTETAGLYVCMAASILSEV